MLVLTADYQNNPLMELLVQPSGAFSPVYLLLLAAALVISALGFIRTVYFVSIGYGFSIAVQAVILVVLHRSGIQSSALIQLLLLTAYGLRLGIYLSFREGKAAYRRELQDVKSRGADIGVLKKIAIWIGVAILYVMMVSPALYRVRSGIDGRLTVSALAWTGTVVMMFGLFMEGLADLQKSRFKSANPDRFCNIGLFRMVRCPNYLGEILFWTGNLIAGAASLKGIFPWTIGAVSWICITLIMLGSTKRLEAKQEQRYGNREDFKAWCQSTPVLFPLVPVYTLKNIRVYLE